MRERIRWPGSPTPAVASVLPALARKPEGAPNRSYPASPLSTLHEVLGNRRIAEILEARSLARQETGPATQPGLAISSPQGALEQEADQVANRMVALDPPAGGSGAETAAETAEGSRPLPEAMRASFEPRFGADF